MTPVWTLTMGWLLVSGFVGFILMGIDKARAVDREWRIPEKTFFMLALVGGAFGVLAGSSVFHHKTLKPSFMGVIILLTLAWLGILVYLQSLIGSPFG